MELAHLRDPDFAAIVRTSEARRFRDPGIVDQILALDEQWRKAQFTASQRRKEINVLKKLIGEKRKTGEAISLLIEQKELMEATSSDEEKDVSKLKDELDKRFLTIGNLVHDTVPVSKTENDNVTLRTIGELRPHQNTRPHHELLYMIGGYEPEAGSKVAGHRGYFLKDIGLLLNQAIINYSLTFLRKRGYTLLQTPFMMRKEVMAKTAQLSDFDEQLYKIVDNDSDDKERYLIATSEQPISAFHMNEFLEPGKLPIRYGGFSTNFRKEAGGAGRDVWGIFRVHQFEKVEQFILTDPEKSWAMHEEMIRVSEEFFQSLGIAYRVINIVSGALNDAAAKKYDLEGWFPGLNEFRELVSCSNCTDYQSRRMKITTMSGGTKKYVHMLNSTLCATSRVICVLLETYQTDKGITVPAILQPYLAGIDFIPFIREYKAK